MITLVFILLVVGLALAAVAKRLRKSNEMRLEKAYRIYKPSPPIPVVPVTVTSMLPALHSYSSRKSATQDKEVRGSVSPSSLSYNPPLSSGSDYGSSGSSFGGGDSGGGGSSSSW